MIKSTMNTKQMEAFAKKAEKQYEARRKYSIAVSIKQLEKERRENEARRENESTLIGDTVSQ